MKLVYIAGYGRSGSTVLDMLLGSHPNVIGLSELTHAFRFWSNDLSCSCGNDFHQCEFWKPVFEQLQFEGDVSSKDMIRWTRRIESCPIWFSRLFQRKALRHYASMWTQLFQAIDQLEGNPILIDSSKTTRLTTWRAKLLATVCDLDVSTVHLVRDPRAVMWSYLRGNNLELEKGNNVAKKGGAYRVLISWILANSAVHLTQFFSRLPYARIRYEDLVADPAKQLTHLASKLDLPLQIKTDYDSDSDAECESSDTNIVAKSNHGVAGNRVRRKGFRRLTLDDQWKTALKKRWANLTIFCWPFMKRYGY